MNPANPLQEVADLLALLVCELFLILCLLVPIVVRACSRQRPVIVRFVHLHAGGQRGSDLSDDHKDPDDHDGEDPEPAGERVPVEPRPPLLPMLKGITPERARRASAN